MSAISRLRTVADLAEAMAFSWLEGDETPRFTLAGGALLRVPIFSWESKIAALRSVYDIGLDRQDSKCL